MSEAYAVLPAVQLLHVLCCLLCSHILHVPLCLAPAEVDVIRREYGDAVAAYGCLGVLQINQGTETFHYLLLLTDCQSVGKVTVRLMTILQCRIISVTMYTSLLLAVQTCLLTLLAEKIHKEKKSYQMRCGAAPSAVGVQ